jgi:hypothetical protein
MWLLSPTTPTRTTTSCWQRCSQHWRRGQTPRWRRCPPAQAARHVGTRAAARRAWPATHQPTPASSAWRSMGGCRRGPGAGRQQRGPGVMGRGGAAAASTPQLGSVSSTGWWGARHARLGFWTHAGGWGWMNLVQGPCCHAVCAEMSPAAGPLGMPVHMSQNQPWLCSGCAWACGGWSILLRVSPAASPPQLYLDSPTCSAPALCIVATGVAWLPLLSPDFPSLYLWWPPTCPSAQFSTSGLSTADTGRPGSCAAAVRPGRPRHPQRVHLAPAAGCAGSS